MRIALAQINPTVGDLELNKKKILTNIDKAKSLNCDIVVFPELIITGYPPEDLLLKDHFVQDNIKVLRSIVKKVEGITAVIGFVNSDKQKGLYNAAAIISDGKVRGVYHKKELPNYGVFDEKRYFTPGTENKIYQQGNNVFGVSICEDVWVDKGVCQRQAQLGAKLLINISSSPFDEYKFKQREQVLKRRARETKAYICYTNLVGGQDELVFDGGSFIISPQGTVIASGRQFDEDLVIADINVENKQLRKSRDIVALSPIQRSKGKPKPIKPQKARQLNQIESIYAALVVGTRDYIKKNGFQKAVIGLSGGIDSAVVAAVAVDAIGRENVIGVSMPSKYSSKGTKADAKKLAKNLGIKFREIPIEPIVQSYTKSLHKEFAGTKPNVAEENIQARIRGNLLMSLSNKFGWIVLTTGNKSELAVGYCTLYGDMSGGFAVIKDVSKMQVFEIARFRNKQGSEIIPQSIIKRPPSAELRANQKDQDSLPPYSVLDKMLKEYVEQHQSLGSMSKKNAQKLVKQVINLVDKNEYKRRQAPPGIKISTRAFGKDWRLPITNKYREF